MLISLKIWKDIWSRYGVSLSFRGDNTGALSLLAALKGRSKAMNIIARELALEIGDGVFFPQTIAHLPGVSNGLADSLSRAFQPDKKMWSLPRILHDVHRTLVPRRSSDWWHTLKHEPARP